MPKLQSITGEDLTKEELGLSPSLKSPRPTPADPLNLTRAEIPLTAEDRLAAESERLMKEFPDKNVSEETAFRAKQFLDASKPREELTTDQAVMQYDILDASYRSYVEKNRAQNLPHFPTETSKLNAKRNQQFANLYTKDPADYLDEDKLKEYQFKKSRATDPEAYHARAANRAYLEGVNGAPIADDKYDFARDQFARLNFGLEDDTSDKALFQAIKSRHDSHAQAGELVKKRGNELYLQGLEGATRKDLESMSFLTHARNAGIPEEYLTRSGPQLESAFRQGQADRRDAMTLVKGIVQGFALRRGRDINQDQSTNFGDEVFTSVGQAVDALADYNEDKRGRVLHLVSQELDRLPEISDDKSLAERGVFAATQGATTLRDGMGQFIDMLLQHDEVLGGTDEDKKKRDVRMQLGAALSGQLASIKKWNPTEDFFDNPFEKMVLGGMQQLPNMVTVFAGIPGLATLGVSMGGTSYGNQRLDSPEGSQGTQALAATLSGGLQAGTEVFLTKAGFKLMGGKVPGLATLFAKGGITNPLARSAIAFPLAALGATAVEYTEEVVQDATDNILTDIARELSALDSDTDWGEFLTRWTSRNAMTEEVLYSIVPFAFLGAGAVTSFRHFQHGEFLQNATPIMKGLGMKPDVIREIQEASPTEAAKLVQGEVKRVGERSKAEEASKPASELAEEGQQRAAVLKSVREAAKLARDAGFPLLTEEKNEFTEEDQWVLRAPGQKAEVFETEEAAAEALQSWAIDQQQDNRAAINDAALQEVIEFLTEEGQLAHGTRMVERDVVMTQERAIKEGFASMALMKARANIFALQEGTTGNPTDLRIMARRFAQVSTRGVYRGTVEYYRGADPLNLLEDLAETNWHKAITLGFYDGNELLQHLREVQQITGNKYVSDDYQYSEDEMLGLLEGISKLSVEYALGQVNAESFPAKLKRWLEYMVAFAGAAFRHAKTLARSKNLMDKIKEGKIDEKFLSQVADSVGLNDAETRHRREQLQAAEAHAQALGDFEEISSSLRGRIPHPQTLLKNSDPLHGDVARIHESMKKITRRKNKKGQGVVNSVMADNYFLSLEDGKDVKLDEVRRSLNEDGYNFETPAEMIEALEDSLLYGIKTHATGNFEDAGSDSFSMAGVAPATASFIEPGFYSQLENVIELKMGKSASVDQILGMINPTKGSGIKADEIKWSGIEEALPGLAENGKVSKDKLLTYLRENGRIQFRTLRSSKNLTSKNFTFHPDSFLPIYQDYQLKGGTNYLETVLALPAPSMDERLPSRDETYTSPHFSMIPNYVAHMRTNEREDSNGQPGLFIEEIQSDRHQEGRKKGYVSDEQTASEDEGSVSSVNLNTFKPKPIADAPFRKEWPLAMFKRALRAAVSTGQEWIGWTSGDIQNARYDLSYKIDNITYSQDQRDGEETVYHVVVKDSHGNTFNADKNLTPSMLEQMLGKDLAQKIVKGAGENVEPEFDSLVKEGFYNMLETKSLSGLDLQVGGEGMEVFYDKMLPAAVQKYVKKWGGKVTQQNLQIGLSNNSIWHMEITEEMRDSVNAGQSSFSVTPAQDAEYMELAKKPEQNREKLRVMVRRAAKLAGAAPGRWFHGSNNLFKSFDPSKGSFRGALNNMGSWFTTDRKQAERFAEFYDIASDGHTILGTNKGHVYDTFLFTKNPKFFIDESGEKDGFTMMKEFFLERSEATQLYGLTRSEVQAAVNELKAEGYDGISLYTSLDSTERADPEQYYQIVFDPKKIKSGELVTKDDAGNVIPLSQRFDLSSDQISFSVAPAQDAEYMAAVESGDVETQQNLVDQVAQKAGFTIGPVYHGTDTEFTIFDVEAGAWFATDRDDAVEHSEKSAEGQAGSARVVSAYLNPGRVFVIPQSIDMSGEISAQEALEIVNEENGTSFTLEQIGSTYNDLVTTGPPGKSSPSWRESSGPDADYVGNAYEFFGIAENFVKTAKAAGFDSLSAWDMGEQHYAALYPQNIKSADPVTRDADGNVIPLSQRFDEMSDQISFSVDYRGTHSAPLGDYGGPGHNLSDYYPDDIYGPNGARYYGHSRPGDQEAINVIRSMRDKPNAAVKVYRAIPKFAGEINQQEIADAEKELASKQRMAAASPHLWSDDYFKQQIADLEEKIPGKIEKKINPGDWVTTVRSYAKEHGEASLQGNYQVVSKTVKAKEIFTEGNSIYEWGYDPTGNASFSMSGMAEDSNPIKDRKGEDQGKPLTETEIREQIEDEPGTLADIKIDDDLFSQDGDDSFSVASNVPIIKRSSLKGKKKFVYFSDWTRVGVYTGLHAGSGIAIDLQGGPGFPYIDGHKKKGKAGWAFTTEGMFTRFQSRVNQTDGIGLTTLYGKDNLRANPTFLKAYVEELKYAVKAKLISKAKMLEALNKARVQVLGLSSKRKNKKTGKVKVVYTISRDGKTHKDFSKDWTSIAQFNRAMKGATFEVRAAMFSTSPKEITRNKVTKKVPGEFSGGRLANKTNVKAGMPDVIEMINLFADPMFDGAEYGTIVGAIQFEKGQTSSVKAQDIGAEKHLSYPVITKGKGLGLFDSFIHANKVVANPGNKSGFQLTRSSETSMAPASFSLSAPGIERLEVAVLAKLNKGPEERIDYASKLIDRLHGLRQKTILAPNTDDAERIKENLQEAQAIFTALPVEARPKASFPIGALTDKNLTEKGKLTIFEKMIDSADKALEVYLQKQYLESLTKLFDLAKPDLRQNKSLRTRLSPNAQRLATAAFEVSVMSPEEVINGLQSIQTTINNFTSLRDQAAIDGDKEAIKKHSDTLHDAERYQRMLNTFGALPYQSSYELAEALDNLRHIYAQGKFERDIIDDRRRQDLDGMRESVLPDLGGRPASDEWQRNTAKEGFFSRMGAFAMGSLSFHQIMEKFFPTSDAARQFQKRIRTADRDVTRARINARERFEAHLRKRWGKGKLGQAKILAELSKRVELPNKIREWKNTEEVAIDPELAKKILDGTTTISWSDDPIALQSLRQALADFNLKRLRDQSRAELVRFKRVISRAPARPLVISPLETVYILQLAGQEQYLPALDRYGYTEGVIDALRQGLPDEARDIADFLANEYAGEYDRLNPVYRTLFHMDMPRVKNYAPGSFEHMFHTTTPDPDGTEAAPVNALSAGFTKARQHHIARPQQRNALEVFWNHHEQTEYFIAWAEVSRDMGAVFKTPDVRRALESKYGKKVATNFFNWIDGLATDFRKPTNEEQSMREFVNNAQASLSAIGLAVNVGSLLKQFSAGTGAMLEMPTSKAVAGMYRAITNPSSFKDLWETDTIQQRIKQGMSPEDRAILEASNAKPSTIMALLEAGRAPLGLVDGIFTTLSAMIAYNYHLAEAKKAGLSPEKAEAHALEVMDRVIVRTAQPATAQDKSLIENTSKGFTKFLLIFRSDPRQKMALAMEAVDQFSKGKMGKLELARRFFWGWGVYGILAQIATDLWHAISREEDEELSLDDYIYAGIAGPITGLPLFGSIVDTGIRNAINALGGDLQIFTNSTNPLDKAAFDMFRGRTLKKLTDDEDDTAGEIMKAILSDSRAWAQVLGVFAKATAIVPVTARAVRDAYGMIENALPDSPEQEQGAILDKFLEESKEARDEAADRKEILLEELQGMDKAAQKDRLNELDKTLARSLMKSLSDATLTENEKKLRRIPTKERHKAIQAILKTLAPAERGAYLQRLREVKILTGKIERMMQ